MKDKEQKAWILTVGFYPGVLFGFRSYEEKEFTNEN